MADRDTTKPQKQIGKFHYDPEGMPGRKAGRFQEHEKDENEQERTEKDGGDRLGRRKT